MHAAVIVYILITDHFGIAKEEAGCRAFGRNFASAMVQANYRTLVIFVSVMSALLGTTVLAFIANAITGYRARDFLNATNTEDFGSFGTCVEGLTEAQLKWDDYDDPNIECGVDRESGKRGSIRNSLAVSVHGIWYTYSTAPLYDAGTPPKYYPEHIYDAINEAASAVVTATVGNAEAERKTLGLEENHWSGRVPAGINTTTAYLALHYVAQQKVPTSCDELYGNGLSYETIKENVYGEVEFMRDIREGKYVGKYEMGPNMDTKDSWPLRDIVIDCNYDESVTDEYVPNSARTPGTYPIDVSDGITAQQRALLHAHCHAQFDFASVGTIEHHAGTLSGAGTWMIPLPGIEPGPKWLPFIGLPDGFYSNTTSYSAKARTYLGLRFGLSLFAYVPMLMTTCFLLADSVAFFLSEISMPAVLKFQRHFYLDDDALNRDSLTIVATRKTSRYARAAVCVVALFFSCLFYYIFVILPWGFFYTHFPRPICDEWEPMELWFSFGLWEGTNGGWKTDWQAKWYDTFTFLGLAIILVLLPVTTSYVFRDVNKTLGGGDATKGSVIVAAIKDTVKIVKNTAEYQQLRGPLFLVMILAMAVVIGTQAYAGRAFGGAWMESIVNMPHEWAEESPGNWVQTPKMNTAQLGDLIYDQTIATLALTVVAGLVIGAVLQRHLFGGMGCFATLAFFGWVALIIVFALPLFVYSSIRSIGHQDSAGYDCTEYTPSTFETASNDGVCNVRYWGLIGGGSVFAGIVALITVLGAGRHLNFLLRRPKKMEEIPYNQPGHSLANPSKKVTGLNKAYVSAPLMQDCQDVQQLPLGGYRSSTNFFNFKTKRTDSDTFLYAPRMHTPAAR